MTTRTFVTGSLAAVVLSVGALAGAQETKLAEMAPRATAQVGPFTVAPHWSRYDYPTSIPEGKAYHMVVKGDTLWDIAGRYLGNPFLWPQIWEANGYVKKARLIYPGDPILLPTVQVAEPAVTGSGESAQSGSASGEEAMPSSATAVTAPPPVPDWNNPDSMVSVGSAEAVRAAGYISASIEDESLKIKSMEAEGGSAIEQVSGGSGAFVLLNRGASSGVKAGDLYTIHRRVRVVKHPATGKRIGYRIDSPGVVRVLMVTETSARAVIETSNREALVGDYLRPVTDVEIPMVKRRVLADGGDLSLDGSRTAGYVVDIDDDSSVSATGVTIGVDLGLNTGASIGRVITVYRQNDLSDSLTKRAMGAGVVLAVRGNLAVARLVYSREEMVPGDRVLLQP